MGPGLLSLLVLGIDPLACPSQGTATVVSTALHQMALCENGTAVHTYPVAIGSNGPAPGRVGWAQTPLGKFTLQLPRASAQFHLFVPLANPDPKRFSAWAIGIHGPPRDSKDDGKINVSSDWTWGCIAVSSDAEIEQIAAWIREKRVARIELR
jgi:hypothetical protein